MNTPARCVLIDDSQLDNMIAKKMLSRVAPNAEIVVFTDPNKALSYLQFELPLNTNKTAIFLDINMPLMNGLETLEHMKLHPDLSGIPVLILSTSGDALSVNLARSMGADGYLVKPFGCSALEGCLRQALSVDFSVRRSDRTRSFLYIPFRPDPV